MNVDLTFYFCPTTSNTTTAAATTKNNHMILQIPLGLVDSLENNCFQAFFLRF